MTVSINITDDNDDEGDEVFGLVIKRTDGTPDTVQIIGPTTAFGIIEDNDEPGTNLLDGFVDQPNTRQAEPDGAWVTIIDDDCKLTLLIMNIFNYCV